MFPLIKGKGKEVRLGRKAWKVVIGFGEGTLGTLLVGLNEPGKRSILFDGHHRVMLQWRDPRVLFFSGETRRGEKGCRGGPREGSRPYPAKP